MAMRNMMNTITLITIRNTPQTISLMMYQRILTIQRKQRNRNVNIVHFHTKSVNLALMQAFQCRNFPLHEFCCYCCFHIHLFLFLMRIQELRELSFQPYMPPVYPTFFLCVFLSLRSFSFRVLQKGREWVEQGFSKKKYYPQGWRFFLKTIEHPNPGFTFAPRTGTIHLMRLPERPSKWR